RDPDVQPFGRGARSSTVLQQRALLASVFRHEPADPRYVCACRLPSSRAALRRAGTGGSQAGEDGVGVAAPIFTVNCDAPGDGDRAYGSVSMGEGAVQ